MLVMNKVCKCVIEFSLQIIRPSTTETEDMNSYFHYFVSVKNIPLIEVKT
jgi:hypothetical protein